MARHAISSFFGLSFGPGSFWVLFEALGIFVGSFLNTHTLHTKVLR